MEVGEYRVRITWVVVFCAERSVGACAATLAPCMDGECKSGSILVRISPKGRTWVVSEKDECVAESI